MSSCFVQAKRHLSVVKEDEVLALVRDESFEVRAHDAVPCRPVLHLKLCLRPQQKNKHSVQ